MPKAKIIKSVKCTKDGKFKRFEDCVNCEYFESVDKQFTYVTCKYKKNDSE